MNLKQHNQTKTRPVPADSIVIYQSVGIDRINLPIKAYHIETWEKIERFAEVKLSFAGKEKLDYCRG